MAQDANPLVVTGVSPINRGYGSYVAIPEGLCYYVRDSSIPVIGGILADVGVRDFFLITPDGSSQKIDRNAWVNFDSVSNADTDSWGQGRYYVAGASVQINSATLPTLRLMGLIQNEAQAQQAQAANDAGNAVADRNSLGNVIRSTASSTATGVVAGSTALIVLAILAGAIYFIPRKG